MDYKQNKKLAKLGFEKGEVLLDDKTEIVTIDLDCTTGTRSFDKQIYVSNNATKMIVRQVTMSAPAADAVSAFKIYCSLPGAYLCTCSQGQSTSLETKFSLTNRANGIYQFRVEDCATVAIAMTAVISVTLEFS